MDKYEQLSVVGEGSYGVVLKCRRRDTGRLVAIKKFIETEDDAAVKKMALREIRMLKKLRHEHLVNLLEVFRRRRRWYLVLEYLERSLLDELEARPGGLGPEPARRRMFQLLRGIEYCHRNSIIHRDVKPENVLVSAAGVVKLCDLGFARALAAPGEPYTEYVATRWYRAPELLVAEHRYGPEVDVWALGCLLAEMLTGAPLLPGDSDIDQIALIVRTIGRLAPRHQQVVARLAGGALRAAGAAGAAGAGAGAAGAALPGSPLARELMAACLRTEPRARPPAAQLLRHKYFTGDGFAESFSAELRKMMAKDGQVLETASSQRMTARDARARTHWTVNTGSDSSRPRTNSTGESLIDCSLPPARGPAEAAAGTRCAARADADESTLPVAPAKSLGRAIDDTFHTFPVPVNSYPRTPYIKKIDDKLVIDENLLRGADTKPSGYRTQPELTLPCVAGASSLKKSKKLSHKTQDNFYGAHREPRPPRAPHDLPYM